MEADPLASTQEVAEEPNIDYSAIIQHLKQTGKVKKLDKWVPHDLTANQKDCHFEMLSSHNLHSNNEPFLDWMCLVTKSGFYMTTDKNQLSSWTLKKLQSTSQSQTCTTKKKKKVMVIVWLSAAGLIHYSFLNPGKTITSEKYAQQIKRCSTTPASSIG